MTALIFDTETHKLHGDIIEAAGISIEPNIFIKANISAELCLYPELIIGNSEKFNNRYKPSEQISFGAMAVHLIADEDLGGCPIFTEFNFPIDDLQYLIGHNIDYDIAAVNRSGTSTDGIKAICTLAMSRYIWPELDAHNLSAMALYVSTNRSMTAHMLRFAHSALTDCMTTLSVLCAIIHKTGVSSFEELYQFSEQTRIPTHIFRGKYKGRLIASLDEWDIKWLLKRTDDNYLALALHDQLNKLTQDSSLSFDEDLL